MAVAVAVMVPRHTLPAYHSPHRKFWSPAKCPDGKRLAVPRRRPSQARPVRAGPPAGPDQPAPDVAAILPAAHAARDELHQRGQPLTRNAIAARLRQAGHQIRNANLTPLLQALRNEAA